MHTPSLVQSLLQIPYTEVEINNNIKPLKMKKEKIVDFSNVFSSKSQSLIAKHQLSKTQKLSPMAFSPLSPLAKAKPQYITNLPKVQDFKSMDKIKLSEENIKNIMESLQLQAKAQKRLEQRTKTNQLYLSFVENPFTKEFTADEPRLDYQQQENIRSIDIVSEMTNLHHIDLQSHLRKQVPPLESQIKNLYNRLKKRIEKDRKKAFELNKENINPSKDTDVLPSSKNSDELAALDTIINSKDEPFFRNYYKRADKNIFQLINNPAHVDFRSNRQVLERYYFCVDSMVGAVVTKQKKNKLHINHVQSFSTFTRDLARNVMPKKLPEKMMLIKGDILLNLQELKFQEIMNVCNNKLTSRTLLEYLRQEEIDSKKKGEQQNSEVGNQPLVGYDKNCRNRMDNHNPINQDKAEIDYYHKSALSNIQVRQKQLSNIYFNKLKKVIQQQAEVISKSIRDKKVLNHFRKKKDTILTQILQTNVDERLSHFKEVERNIRMNKVNKNRTEKLKIDTLTKSFQIKREMETSINKSLTKKERKYSPMQTWRG